MSIEFLLLVMFSAGISQGNGKICKFCGDACAKIQFRLKTLDMPLAAF